MTETATGGPTTETDRSYLILADRQDQAAMEVFDHLGNCSSVSGNYLFGHRCSFGPWQNFQAIGCQFSEGLIDSLPFRLIKGSIGAMVLVDEILKWNNDCPLSLVAVVHGQPLKHTWEDSGLGKVIFITPSMDNEYLERNIARVLSRLPWLHQPPVAAQSPSPQPKSNRAVRLAEPIEDDALRRVPDRFL